jgi:hypothetical protein
LIEERPDERQPLGSSCRINQARNIRKQAQGLLRIEGPAARRLMG